MNNTDFSRLEYVWVPIKSAIDNAYHGCDCYFRNKCGLKQRDETTLKESFFRVYHDQIASLEQECFCSNDDTHILDARKIAAVICCSLIQEKAFIFDEDQAIALLEEEQAKIDKCDDCARVKLNKWIARNFLINYRTAYFAALHILYRVLLAELIHNSETIKYAKTLNDIGKLYTYPEIQDWDNFDVSVILGLGRQDIHRNDVNIFLLASQFYQIEMYTRKSLGLI